mmetsp:Transcript_1218/g.3654  ORF Transcript_1218/g.3654 Transcript_1218/m.3654 type:complete len:205 (-) Transcript_1218:723-1337(-)
MDSTALQQIRAPRARGPADRDRGPRAFRLVSALQDIYRRRLQALGPLQRLHVRLLQVQADRHLRHPPHPGLARRDRRHPRPRARPLVPFSHPPRLRRHAALHRRRLRHLRHRHVPRRHLPQLRLRGGPRRPGLAHRGRAHHDRPPPLLHHPLGTRRPLPLLPPHPQLAPHGVPGRRLRDQPPQTRPPPARPRQDHLRESRRSRS